MLNSSEIVKAFLLGKYPEQIAEDLGEPIQQIRRILTSKGFDAYEHIVAAVKHDAELMSLEDVKRKYSIGTAAYWSILARENVTGDVKYADGIEYVSGPRMAKERDKVAKKVVFDGVEYIDVTDFYIGG